MDNPVFKRYLPFFSIVIILFYLILGTGLHSDDYMFVTRPFNGWLNFLIPSADQFQELLFGIPTYYAFFWAFPVFGFEHQWAYDLIKVVAHVISFYGVYKFACDYIPHDRAMIASALFILYPLHDTTMYWYICAPYILLPAIIMYAHYLMRNEKILLSVFLLFLGVFGGFVSPPWVFGLVPIFLFERKYLKAILFSLPGVLYTGVYFWILKNITGASKRIDTHINLIAYIKQLIFQTLSFIEAAIGPSYWLKVYYSIGSIGFFSAIIAIGIVIIFFFKVASYSERPQFSKSLYVGLLSILMLSFGMYALTALYPQSAFNLGNRSTVSGSLLIAFLLALLPLNKKTVVFFALIFIFPVFGLSDYWKSWNTHQKLIIENIQTNKELKKIESGSTVMVTGNMYSLLGPFSHIDFFVTPRLFTSLFRDLLKKNDVFPLTSNIYLNNSFLIDGKLGGKHVLSDKMYVYNSETHSVNKISTSAVPKLLADRPREIRHWVQLAKGTWIESGIVYLNPTYARLFN